MYKRQIHQERYIDQLAVDYKDQFTINEMPHPVSKEERTKFDRMEPAKDGEETCDRKKYLELIGKLVWPMSMTRPDIAMEIGALCAAVAAPTPHHYSMGLHVIGYLVRTRSLGITYGGRIRKPIGLDEMPPGFAKSSGLYVVHDSSFGTRPRPMGGHVMMYANGAVSWSA